MKKQKSHISISSNENNNNSFNRNKKNSKDKIKQPFNNENIEKYLNKLILISLKHKKFLERHDYFYSQLKRKNNLKKVKLKLTPFQKYEKLKNLSKKIKLNKNFLTLNTNFKNTNNIILKNYQNLKKNKTENNQFCLTNYRPNSLNNNYRVRNRTKIYINSIKTNYNNDLYEPKMIKNKFSFMSYDNNKINTMNISKKNKTCQTFRNKTAYKTISKRLENSLSNIIKSKKKISILTSALNRPLKIINLKSRNKKRFDLPYIKNDNNTKYNVPLIHMDDSKFLNEILSNGK